MKGHASLATLARNYPETDNRHGYDVILLSVPRTPSVTSSSLVSRKMSRDCKRLNEIMYSIIIVALIH